MYGARQINEMESDQMNDYIEYGMNTIHAKYNHENLVKLKLVEKTLEAVHKTAGSRLFLLEETAVLLPKIDTIARIPGAKVNNNKPMASAINNRRKNNLFKVRGYSINKHNHNNQLSRIPPCLLCLSRSHVFTCGLPSSKCFGSHTIEMKHTPRSRSPSGTPQCDTRSAAGETNREIPTNAISSSLTNKPEQNNIIPLNDDEESSQIPMPSPPPFGVQTDAAIQIQKTIRKKLAGRLLNKLRSDKLEEEKCFRRKLIIVQCIFRRIVVHLRKLQTKS